MPNKNYAGFHISVPNKDTKKFKKAVKLAALWHDLDVGEWLREVVEANRDFRRALDSIENET